MSPRDEVFGPLLRLQTRVAETFRRHGLELVEFSLQLPDQPQDQYPIMLVARLGSAPKDPVLARQFEEVLAGAGPPDESSATDEIRSGLQRFLDT